MPYLIPFNSYLVNTVITEMRGSMNFDRPGEFIISDSFNFSYTINLKSEDLIQQSKIFANAIITKLGYRKTPQKRNSMKEDIEDIARAYQYSWLKCVYYSYRFQNVQHEFMHDGSLVFGGHKLIYDTVRKKFIWNISRPDDVSVQRVLTVKDDLITEIDRIGRMSGSNDSICKLFVEATANGIQGGFFIPECEYTLQMLSSSYTFLDIRPLYDPTPYTNETMPLGNCVYSKDADATILYLNNSRLYNDRISLYWGTACFITIDEEDLIDADDRFYRTKDINNVNIRQMRGYEIEAITGYRPFATVDNTGIGGYNKPDGTSPVTPKPQTGWTKGGGKGNPNTPYNGKGRQGKNPPKSPITGGNAPINNIRITDFGEVTYSNGQDIQVLTPQKFNLKSKVRAVFDEIYSNLQWQINNGGLDKLGKAIDIYHKLVDGRHVSGKEINYLSHQTGVYLPVGEDEVTTTISLGPLSRQTRRLEYNVAK